MKTMHPFHFLGYESSSTSSLDDKALASLLRIIKRTFQMIPPEDLFPWVTDVYCLAIPCLRLGEMTCREQYNYSRHMRQLLMHTFICICVWWFFPPSPKQKTKCRCASNVFRSQRWHKSTLWRGIASIGPSIPWRASKIILYICSSYMPCVSRVHGNILYPSRQPVNHIYTYRVCTYQIACIYYIIYFCFLASCIFSSSSFNALFLKKRVWNHYKL